MASAFEGPMPGKSSSSAAVAVLMFTTPSSEAFLAPAGPGKRAMASKATIQRSVDMMPFSADRTRRLR